MVTGQELLVVLPPFPGIGARNSAQVALSILWAIIVFQRDVELYHFFSKNAQVAQSLM